MAETPTTRKPEEFRDAVMTKGITQWPIHRCSICGYQCAYLFNYADAEVMYDAGCDCVIRWPMPRTWADVAAQYNMQSHPPVIAAYDAFWGFGGVPTEETP